MGGRFRTLARGIANVADFGAGQPCLVKVFHGGLTVVIAATGDPAFQVPHLIPPAPGVVQIVMHGVPGRFATASDGTIEIPIPLVAAVLDTEGIPRGTPLRCLTCHAGEDPLQGDPAGRQLAREWRGPVAGPNGFLKITLNSLLVHVGEWDPDPVFGGEVFTITGSGQGTFLEFPP